MILSPKNVFGLIITVLLAFSVQATVGVDDCIKTTRTEFRKEDQEVFFFKNHEYINGSNVVCRTINGQLQIYPKDRDTRLLDEIVLRRTSYDSNGIMVYQASANLPKNYTFDEVKYFCDRAPNKPSDVYILESCWVQYSLLEVSESVSLAYKIVLVVAGIGVVGSSLLCILIGLFTGDGNCIMLAFWWCMCFAKFGK